MASWNESNSEEEDEILLNYSYSLVRRKRVIRTRPHYFHLFDDQDFYSRFRLDKDTVSQLYNRIAVKINPASMKNDAVAGIDRLLLTLRFYATGSFLVSIADFGGISKASASTFIRLVTDAICLLRPEIVRFPSSVEDIESTRETFYRTAGFPCVIGALDCTHVKTLSPGGNIAEYFRNRKLYFSLNVQAICNSEMEFLDVVARWPGAAHDQRVFNNSRIRSRFEAGEFGDSLLVGDAGYQNRPYLVTPKLPSADAAETLYNESHFRPRNVIERTFGVLKRRFPILATGIRCRSSHLLMAIVHATTILHNLAVRANIGLPVDEELYVAREVPVVDALHAGDTSRREQLINNYFRIRARRPMPTAS